MENQWANVIWCWTTDIRLEEFVVEWFIFNTHDKIYACCNVFFRKSLTYNFYTQQPPDGMVSNKKKKINCIQSHIWSAALLRWSRHGCWDGHTRMEKAMSKDLESGSHQRPKILLTCRLTRSTSSTDRKSAVPRQTLALTLPDSK
jgi:hypothetical protein